MECRAGRPAVPDRPDRVCEEGLRRFPAEDELMTENRRCALAESYFELGESDTAEALYRDWLQADVEPNRFCAKGWPST